MSNRKGQEEFKDNLSAFMMDKYLIATPLEESSCGRMAVFPSF